MMFTPDISFKKRHNENTISYFSRIIPIPLMLALSAYFYFTHTVVYSSIYLWLALKCSSGLISFVSMIIFFGLYAILLCYLKFIRLDYGAGEKTKDSKFFFYRYSCIFLEFILIINTMVFLFGILGYLKYQIAHEINETGNYITPIMMESIKKYLCYKVSGYSIEYVDLYFYYSFIPASIILLIYKCLYVVIRDIFLNRFNVNLSNKIQKQVKEKYKKDNLTLSDVDEEHKILEETAKTKEFNALDYIVTKGIYKLIKETRNLNYNGVKSHTYKLNKLKDELNTHYKENGLFVGLNQDNLAASIPFDTWVSSHTSICGLTGRGKGVVSGCLLAQNIWMGFSNVICDPKKNGGDRWMFYVMQEMIKCYNSIYGTDRKVHYINLNISEPQINLLGGISKLEFKECLSAGFNLVLKDTDADHYRKNDIEQMEYLSELIDSVNSMPEYWENLYKNHLDELLDNKANLKAEDKIHDDTVKNNLSSFSRDLKSLALMPVLRTDDGIDLEKAILNGDVLYINGSSDSTNIKRLQKMLLHRCIQVVAKTANNINRPHVTFFIDETTYFLSRPLKTAVSTIRDQRANFIFNFQGIDNLRDVSESDPSLDGDVIQSVILNNSGTTLVYKVNHEPTRQWAAKMTGEKVVHTTSKELEGVSGNYGTVDATGRVRINEKKQNKFHADVFGLLPKKVGVIFGDLPAQLIFTSPVIVNYEADSRAIDRRPLYQMKSYFFRVPSVDGDKIESNSKKEAAVDIETKADVQPKVIRASKVKVKAFKKKVKPKVESSEEEVLDGMSIFEENETKELESIEPVKSVKKPSKKRQFPKKIKTTKPKED